MAMTEKRMRLSHRMLANLRAGAVEGGSGCARDTYWVETAALLKRGLVARETYDLPTHRGPMQCTRHRLTEEGWRQVRLWAVLREDGHYEGCKDTQPVAERRQWYSDHMYRNYTATHDQRCHECQVLIFAKGEGGPSEEKDE